MTEQPMYPVTEDELWLIYKTDADGIIKIREVLQRDPCSRPHTPAQPAQQRIDAVLKYCEQRHYEVEDDDGIIQEVIPKDEIIALLREGERG